MCRCNTSLLVLTRTGGEGILREHEQNLIDSVTRVERQNLRPDDVSVVVYAHTDGEVYLVEFLTLDRSTVLPFQAREVTSADFIQGRYMEISA